jgi:hypothetical protein
MVVSLFIFGNGRNVYATVGSVSVVPNTVAQGVSFQVSGSGYASFSGSTIYIDVFDAACSVLIEQQTVVVPVSGNWGPLTFSSASLAIGVHCVQVDISGAFDFDGISSVTVTPTPAPPIPEYPIGLPILAIFMILGYAVIKRKIRN